ncbi:unnamed protein product, partial [Amoebophrya sp. A25]
VEFVISIQETPPHHEVSHSADSSSTNKHASSIPRSEQNQEPFPDLKGDGPQHAASTSRQQGQQSFRNTTSNAEEAFSDKEKNEDHQDHHVEAASSLIKRYRKASPDTCSSGNPS